MTVPILGGNYPQTNWIENWAGEFMISSYFPPLASSWTFFPDGWLNHNFENGQVNTLGAKLTTLLDRREDIASEEISPISAMAYQGKG